MKKQGETTHSSWTQEFEKLYILTYEDIYCHANLLTDNDQQAAKELLIQTYTEAYQRKINLPSVEKQVAWLKKVADSLAESSMGYSKEDIESAYLEATRQQKISKFEISASIDEASTYFEIEDRVNLLFTEKESTTNNTATLTAIQSFFSGILLVAAIGMLIVGVMKVKQQLDVMREPFIRPLTASGGTAEDGLLPTTDQIKIKIGGKAVILSDVGQVLYSLPLDEVGMAHQSPENPEIQKQTGWTYYLPCPDRENTQLAEVAPSLHYTLYRIGSSGAELEIIAREVDDYTFWEDNIYVSQFDRIQRIDKNDIFEKAIPGIYAEVKNDAIYLYDTLGKNLKTDTDGVIRYEDQLFEMSDNRIESVRPAPRIKDHVSYFLKETEDGRSEEIYRNINGKEEIFTKQGETIDSFCIVGDWLYYSAYIRRGGSGAHYSELYRKSLVEDKAAELIREEFTGRMYAMYFSEEQNQIYANYSPKSWKSNHGIIAVITMSGQISYLDDKVLRSTVRTTGNDMLEFIMVKDNQVYCYWKDCYWEKGEKPIAIWRKVLILSDDNRIQMEED